jgi:hypothetical protein
VTWHRLGDVVDEVLAEIASRAAVPVEAGEALPEPSPPQRSSEPDAEDLSS